MKNLPKEVLTSGAEIMVETAKYACATTEYTGLVSLSYIRRGGSTLYDPLAKGLAPVCDLTAKAYDRTADGIYRIYEKTAAGLGRLIKALPFGSSRISAVEERLHKIEEWIAEIKEQGIIMPGTDSHGRLKKLTEEKEALLKNILLDNLELKD